MRRGLIAWSKAELPEAVLDARVERTQARMANAGFDALVVYTIPARTAAVSWLTGFVPYWNEGVAVIPRAGRPVLVSALSNRVKGWIERNAHVERVVSNPRIGTEAAAIVSTSRQRAVIGVVDLPRLPAPLIDALIAGGHEVRDATAMLASVRIEADPAELALAVAATMIAQRAFEVGIAAYMRGDDAARDAGRLIGLMEGEARRLGAEEVYPAIALDLDRRCSLIRLEGAARLGERSAVRLSVAYKGVWVRVARTFDGGRADAARNADAGGRTGAAGRADVEAAFASAIARLPDVGGFALAKSWLVEGCRASTPLEPLAGSMIPDGVAVVAGEIVNVQATFHVDGRDVVIGAPVLIGRAGCCASQLAPPRSFG